MVKIDFISWRCIGCRACEAACKQENNLPVGIRWRVVTSSLKGEYPLLKRDYRSSTCRHCAKPKCAEACTVKAIIKEEQTGMVTILDDKCIGCRQCAATCPFGAMSFDNHREKAGKCTLCKHRVESGQVPACVQVCPGIALKFIR